MKRKRDDSMSLSDDDSVELETSSDNDSDYSEDDHFCSQCGCLHIQSEVPCSQEDIDEHNKSLNFMLSIPTLKKVCLDAFADNPQLLSEAVKTVLTQEGMLNKVMEKVNSQRKRDPLADIIPQKRNHYDSDDISY